MKEPIWIKKVAILEVHNRLILGKYGGLTGIRDEGLLESALARPNNKYSYGITDTCVLVASYAFGITKNHPFVDGNKRTAFAAIGLFLERNGVQLIASEAEATQIMLDLASGTIKEDTLVDWLHKNSSRDNK